MIVTENRLSIAAPQDVIYRLAADTERWPEILPHYRYVHVYDDDGKTRTIEMAARYGPIPLHWVARQTNDPVTPRITFKHVAGPTAGMDVEWIFTPLGPEVTIVRIMHKLTYKFPIAADFIGEEIVSNIFIHGVANKTLAAMKRLAEGPARA